MASTASSYNPSRDDFAAMLDESFAGGNLQESSVIKGKVVAIEKDMAVIDVGLKTEGRVALREFNGPGRENDLKVGDEVEVFSRRIENALGEAVLSRDKARREESWGKLERRSTPTRRSRRHLQSGQGWFHRRSRRRCRLPAALAGGYSSDPRRCAADEQRAAVQILKMDRRRGNIVVAPHGSRRDPRRTAIRNWCRTSKKV